MSPSQLMQAAPDKKLCKYKMVLPDEQDEESRTQHLSEA